MLMGKVTMDLYLHNLSVRYRQASKKEKGVMLDEYCATSGHTRKHAIKLLRKQKNGSRMSKSKKLVETRGRKPQYTSPELLEALKRIWLCSDQMCGKRLCPIIGEWLSHYDKHYPPLSDEHKQQLLKMSSATIDRLLRPYRASHPKGKTGTKPGSILKTQIPILTDQWDNEVPGFVEADTVAHCGDSLAGDFIWSLDLTDIATGWTELRACWSKGATGVVENIKDIEESLPFNLKGFDSDNGSEFLNYHLLRYFADPKDSEKLRLQFTRSRPYKKNDNAHVEQKNWSHIRQLLGYSRLDDKALQPLINDLYKNEISLFNNYFRPCVKLLKKERIGSKIKKKHSVAQTPYQRLLDSTHITEDAKVKLKNTYQALDPFELRKQIEAKLKHIFSLVDIKDLYTRVAI